VSETSIESLVETFQQIERLEAAESSGVSMPQVITISDGAWDTFADAVQKLEAKSEIPEKPACRCYTRGHH
jgi:hypothetical protein